MLASLVQVAAVARLVLIAAPAEDGLHSSGLDPAAVWFALLSGYSEVSLVVRKQYPLVWSFVRPRPNHEANSSVSALFTLRRHLEEVRGHGHFG